MNDLLIHTLKVYMAYWSFVTGGDHWHCLKMALDDMSCEGLLPKQATR